MKLSIRYADKIVGVLIVAAIGILVFVIFMIGSSQRWFAPDYNYKTYFPSATGLGHNMPVQYMGFTIGRVKSIELVKDEKNNTDQVEVNFIIYDTYIDRVKSGSQVELVVSPLAALGGNQFLFHPGEGGFILPEGSIITTVNATKQDLNIASIVDTVEALLATLADISLDAKEALEGTQRTSLGRTLWSVEGLIADLRKISGQVASPDSDGDIYGKLVDSLASVSGILQNLEKSSSGLPSKLFQIEALVMEVRKVMEAVENNPILKDGIPEQKETSVGGAYTRNLNF